MTTKLTEGCLAKILSGEKVFGPVVQVLEVRAVQPQQPSGQAHGTKYRLMLSDGVNCHVAYVASQCSKLFVNNTIRQFHVIRLLEACVSEFSNSKFIIIAGVEPVLPHNEQIGNPVPVESAPQPKPEPPAAAAAAAVPPSPMKSTNTVISSPMRQGQKVFTEAAPTVGATVLPIKGLHPYSSFWTIRARVTSKTPLKEFSRKQGGTGKLFSCDLIDEAGDEIRATAFTEAAEKLFDVLQVGHVYLISKGDVKVANKKFTTIQHPFEITFTTTTVVSPVDDDASTAGIPTMHFSFVPIEQVGQLNKDDLVDVIGVVTQASEVQSFVQKATGRDLTKRTLTLLDNTAHSIEVTLWGEKASTEGIDVGVVVAVRAARVGTFNGKSLSTSASSQIVVSPDIPEAKKLATWYQDGGSAAAVTAISDGSSASGEGRDDTVKTIALAQTEMMGKDFSQNANYFFTCMACIVSIRHDKRFSFTSCPVCFGKVNFTTDAQYYCPKCNKSTPEPVECYSINMQIADTTGSIYVSCFRDTAKQIMNNREAAELIALQTEGNEAEFNMAFDDAAHKWFTFRIRAHQENYHEDLRTQYSVYSATPIDYTKECQRLMSIIDSYPGC